MAVMRDPSYPLAQAQQKDTNTQTARQRCELAIVEEVFCHLQ